MKQRTFVKKMDLSKPFLEENDILQVLTIKIQILEILLLGLL